MNKMDRYNHPLVKRQQRKQRHSSGYHDEQQRQLDNLLKELNSDRKNQNETVLTSPS